MLELYHAGLTTCSKKSRLALKEKGLPYKSHYMRLDKFEHHTPEYLNLNPNGIVPTLVHDGFVLYETGAITRYVDRAFAGPALQPAQPRALARMDQIIGIVDAYAYWPLVRQVYVHAVAMPRRGQTGDQKEVQSGLAAAAKVLAALETLAGEHGFLVGLALSLADLHLVSMMAYFVEAPEGAAMLARHPKLQKWFTTLSSRPSFVATDPR